MNVISRLGKDQLLIVVGVVLLVSAFLTDLSKGGGANIGGGILLMAGGICIVVGIIRWALTTRAAWLKVLLLLSAGLFMFGVAIWWQNGENEANRRYCEGMLLSGAPIPEGPDFCNQYRY